MYKVLLVDDEILVREVISQKIEWERLGFELAGDCANGKEAIEFLKDTEVDVVLTDICMPYIDGMELSKYVYENFPKTAVIIFSGYSDFEYAKQAIQYKVAEYILKPVTAIELSEVLVRVKQSLDKDRLKSEKINELEKAYHNYTKNEALITSRMLSQLVKGTQEVEKCLQEMEEHGIKIDSDRYRLAVIDIDAYAELKDFSMDSKKESALMAFVVENITNEIVENYKAGIVYKDSANRTYILFCIDHSWKSEEMIEVICREIQQTLESLMKLKSSIGIGRIVDQLENLQESYKSAIKALEYRYTKGDNVIIDCEKMIMTGNVMELELDFQDIESALRDKDECLLADSLEDIEKWMQIGYVHRRMVVSYLHQLTRIIYDIIHEVNDEFTMSEKIIQDISEAETLHKAMGIVKEYAQSGMLAMCESNKTAGELQACMAIDYIKENYGDPNLNLNQLCEYLNVSISYFSSNFKEETGKTFTEVLNNIRMEKAKQLLKQTNLKNYEIAEKVGFTDPHYFSVVFKKTTGKTPKEYAKEK